MRTPNNKYKISSFVNKFFNKTVALLNKFWRYWGTEISIKEFIYVLLVFIFTTIIFTWPLIKDFTWKGPISEDNLFIVHVLKDNFDKIAKGDLKNFWDLEIFYPYTNTKAFNDHSITLTLISFPLLLFTSNSVVIINYLTFSSFLISAIGMYILLKHYFKSVYLSILGALIFSFSTYHLSMYGHLQILSFQFIPFSIFYLEKFLTEKSQYYKYLILFVVFFTLNALISVYLLAILVVPVVIISVFYLIANLRKREMLISIVKKLIITCVLCLIINLPFLLPYLKVSSDHLTSRSIDTVNAYSASLSSYIITPSENLIWGNITRIFAKNPRQGFGENALNPGYISIFISFIGIILYRKGKNNKEFIKYTLIGFVAVIFTFGPYIYGNTKSICYYLFFLNPLLKALRVTPRFHIITTLCISVTTIVGISNINRYFKNNKLLSKVILGFISVLLLFERICLPYPVYETAYFSDYVTEYEEWLKQVKEEEPVIVNVPFNINPEISVHNMISKEGNNSKILDGYSGFSPWGTEFIKSYIKSISSDEEAETFVKSLSTLGADYIVFKIKKLSYGDRIVLNYLSEVEIPMYETPNFTIFNISMYSDSSYCFTSIEKSLISKDSKLLFYQHNNGIIPWVNCDSDNQKVDITLEYMQNEKVTKTEKYSFYNLLIIPPNIENSRTIPFNESPWFVYNKVKALYYNKGSKSEVIINIEND